MATVAKRAPRKAAPAPAPERVPVLIRAGHQHRGVLYRQDTRYNATPDEVALLRLFGGLVEAG